MSARPGYAFRSVALLAAFVLAAVAVITVRPSDHSSPELTGEWKSWRSDFRITLDGKRYRIEVDSPNGFLGGVYLGELNRDVINVTGPLSPLCGEMRYQRESDKLEFCGEEFDRVPRR
jgi:hypothetical protein